MRMKARQDVLHNKFPIRMNNLQQNQRSFLDLRRRMPINFSDLRHNLAALSTHMSFLPAGFWHWLSQKKLGATFSESPSNSYVFQCETTTFLLKSSDWTRSVAISSSRSAMAVNASLALREVDSHWLPLVLKWRSGSFSLSPIATQLASAVFPSLSSFHNFFRSDFTQRMIAFVALGQTHLISGINTSDCSVMSTINGVGSFVRELQLDSYLEVGVCNEVFSTGIH